MGQLRKAVRRHGSPHRRPRKRCARHGGNRRHDPDPRTAHAARHLRPPARRALHPDGFYSTGDLGHLDEQGFLFYHGRSDDMFKVSGATVYPSEVERALRTIDGVAQAFVTNVPGAAGERVGAAVVCDDALTAEQLHASARRC